MGRATHSKSTQRTAKPATLVNSFNIKTSSTVLDSLQGLKQTEAYQPKVIEHDDYTVITESVSNIYDTTTQFSGLAQKVVSWYEDNELAIKKQDQFADDMLHEFELGSPKDLYRAYTCYLKLRSSRQLRRKAKSENKMLAPIYTYIKSNPTIPKDMRMLCEKCAGIQYDIEHAKYYYKSDVDNS